MKIRLAQECDLPRIGDLLIQVNNVHAQGRPDLFKSGNRKYNDRQLLEIIANPQRQPIFVALDENDSVAAYCFCMVEDFDNGSNRTPIKTLYIDDLCVDSRCRRQNIATELYNHVVDYARSNGFYNITLNVWECNPGARKFYDRCGMKPRKTYLETIL